MKSIRTNIPQNVKTKKSKVAYFIFHQFYILNLGKSAIGRITNMAPDIGIIVLLLDRFFFTMTKTQLVFVFVFAMLTLYVIGIFWYGYDLDKIDAMVGARRNPYYERVYQKAIEGKGDEDL